MTTLAGVSIGTPTVPGPSKHLGAGAERTRVEFCGEVSVVDRLPFTIGRDADFVVDDNRFLHRRFLSITRSAGVWMLGNVGSRLTATISDHAGRLDAFLSPGAVLPLVLERSIVRFTAGPTAYELSVLVPDAAFVATPVADAAGGDTTAGCTDMTPDQLRLILALAEPGLAGTARPGTSLPSSAEAALRLGWTLTKFNRKLDNVCQKLSAQGVRGLHGAPGRLASDRRARLVEYALAVRLVTRDDLGLITADDLRTTDPS